MRVAEVLRYFPLLLSILVIYLLREVFFPFFLAFILAYIFMPIVYILDKFHIPRSISSLTVVILGIIICYLTFVFIIPQLYQQIVLISKNDLQKSLLSIFDQKLILNLKIVIDEFAKALNQYFLSRVNHIWDYTSTTLKIISSVVFIPILSYYFIRDWKLITEFIQRFLGFIGIDTVFIAKIDNILSGYIRGQINLCILTSVFYVLALNLINIQFALLLGILSGFLIVIPYIGLFVGMSFTLIVSLSSGSTDYVIYIIAVYTLGHILEAYVAAPILIGNKIGLHPLLIFFSIYIFGHFFGIIGIIISIPSAAIIKLLTQKLAFIQKSEKV